MFAFRNVHLVSTLELELANRGGQGGEDLVKSFGSGAEAEAKERLWQQQPAVCEGQGSVSIMIYKTMTSWTRADDPAI